jgi:hypothetical protein
MSFEDVLDQVDLLGLPLRDLVICDREEPLLDMIRPIFDLTEFTSDFMDTVREGGAPEIDVGGILNDLNNFADRFSIEENLTSENFHMNYSETLGSIENETARWMLKYIIEANTSQLEPIRQKFQSVLDFGWSIPVQASETSNGLGGLFNGLKGGITHALDSNFDTLTCRVIKCIASPVRNLICSHLVSGCAYWTLSAIFAFIGIFWMEVSLFIRRRSMVNPEVGKDPDGETTDDAKTDQKELDDLNETKFRVKKRRRVKKQKKTEGE